MTAKLKNIWLEPDIYDGMCAIRIDWDNDRHQRIVIESLKPDDVLLAFRNVVQLLEMEIKNNKLS